jgi:hypothetical protein
MAAWKITTVDASAWQEIRNGLRDERTAGSRCCARRPKEGTF